MTTSRERLDEELKALASAVGTAIQATGEAAPMVAALRDDDVALAAMLVLRPEDNPTEEAVQSATWVCLGRLLAAVDAMAIVTDTFYAVHQFKPGLVVPPPAEDPSATDALRLTAFHRTPAGVMVSVVMVPYHRDDTGTVVWDTQEALDLSDMTGLRSADLEGVHEGLTLGGFQPETAAAALDGLGHLVIHPPPGRIIRFNPDGN